MGNMLVLGLNVNKTSSCVHFSFWA